MGKLSHDMRYVAAGEPTLLASFDEALQRECERLESSPAATLRLYGFREKLPTLRAMLRHEKTLWVHVTLQIQILTGLEFGEIMARYFANAPSAKIAEHCRIQRAIAVLNARAAKYPCRRILAGHIVPKTFTYLRYT